MKYRNSHRQDLEIFQNLQSAQWTWQLHNQMNIMKTDKRRLTINIACSVLVSNYQDMLKQYVFASSTRQLCFQEIDNYNSYELFLSSFVLTLHSPRSTPGCSLQLSLCEQSTSLTNVPYLMPLDDSNQGGSFNLSLYLLLTWISFSKGNLSGFH